MSAAAGSTAVSSSPRPATARPSRSPRRPRSTRAAKRFAAGTGPVAVDAERASGYRYTQRAYLVQLRREGAGTVLIDPLPFADLCGDRRGDRRRRVGAARRQPGPALPGRAGAAARRRLFDTELAARLASFERVGLAALTEQLLGFALEKHHSAADWSTRPLPASWLTLRRARRRAAGRPARRARGRAGPARASSAWAHEEFAALVASAGRPTPPRADPWRRTSGIHRVRGRAGAGPGPGALVRPGPDRRPPRHRAGPGAARRGDRRRGRGRPEGRAGAAGAARASAAGRCAGWRRSGSTRWPRPGRCPTASCPSRQPQTVRRRRTAGPSATRSRPRRLARCREVVTRLAAAEHQLPPENLVAPDSVRRLAWTPPEPLDADTVSGGPARPPAPAPGRSACSPPSSRPPSPTRRRQPPDLSRRPNRRHLAAPAGRLRHRA